MAQQAGGRRGSPDRNRIDMSRPEEVRTWTMSLGVSEAELRRAVAAKGDRADRIREFLHGSGE